MNTPRAFEKSSSSDIYQALDAESKFNVTAQIFDLDSTSVSPTSSALRCIDDLGLRLVEDDFVKWKPDAAAHPRNWCLWRKSFDSALVLILDLFT